MTTTGSTSDAAATALTETVIKQRSVLKNNLDSSDMEIVDTDSIIQYNNESYFCCVETSVNKDVSLVDCANNPQNGQETILVFNTHQAYQTTFAQNVK